MSEDIAEYEEELKSVLQEMEALVAEDRAGGGNREERAQQMQEKIKMAKTALKTLKIELRTNNKTDVQKYKDAIKLYNEAITRNEGYAEKMERNELLGDPNADNKDVDQMTVDEICQKGNRIQQDDIQRLKGMTNKMDSMKEIGVNTIVELKDQNERLDNIDKELSEMDSDLKVAGKQLQVIGRRLATDGFIRILVFVAAVCLLVVIIVAVVKKSKKK